MNSLSRHGRMHRLLQRVMMLLLIGALPLAAIGASKGGGGFNSKPKKPKAPPHFETTIASVTPSTLTVRENKTERTLTFTQFTEITVNGHKATATELQPGMFVSFVLTDATNLSRVNATSP